MVLDEASKSDWGEIEAGSPLRTYQRKAVDALVEKLGPTGARPCLAAPHDWWDDDGWSDRPPAGPAHSQAAARWEHS